MSLRNSHTGGARDKISQHAGQFLYLVFYSSTVHDHGESLDWASNLLLGREFGFRKKDIAEWLIHELDQRTTGGTIAYLTGGIKIIWKERIPGKLGVADVVSGTIQLSEELIDDEQNLRNTVCHEFSHLLAYYYSGRTDHGELFFCWAQLCTDKMRPLDMGPVQIKAPRQDSYEFIWQCEKEDCGQEYGRHTKSIDLRWDKCHRCLGALLQTNSIARTLRWQIDTPGTIH
ncbi:hypothetical protein D6D23_09011 [Aureobasidium pullulans]|nr:hypothetical protein D6D23_09011 [Aureobasidium pullulans]